MILQQTDSYPRAQRHKFEDFRQTFKYFGRCNGKILNVERGHKGSKNLSQKERKRWRTSNVDSQYCSGVQKEPDINTNMPWAWGVWGETCRLYKNIKYSSKRLKVIDGVIEWLSDGKCKMLKENKEIQVEVEKVQVVVEVKHYQVEQEAPSNSALEATALLS